jgi:hypothetical protein
MRQLIIDSPVLSPHLTKIEGLISSGKIEEGLLLALKEDIKAFDDIARQYQATKQKLQKHLILG